MNDTLTMGAAFLLGLLSSGHCAVMCGGISGALGLATAKNERGRPRRDLLVLYQLGRVASYTAAGFVAGFLGDRFLAVLDIAVVRTALRVGTGAMLAVSALSLLGVVRVPTVGLGRRLWPHLSRVGRRLLPVANAPRAFAFGMLWGWMPCGLAYNLLLVAMLGAHPVSSAATMAAFGLGTLPALLAAAWGAPRLARYWAGRRARQGGGALLLTCALWVAAAPFLPMPSPWLQAWLPFDCVRPSR